MANQTVSSVARTGSTATWRRKRGEMLSASNGSRGNSSPPTSSNS